MYQPLIPTGSVGLNLDYKNIQKNFQQLNTTFGKDHTTFDDQTTNNGYHKVVHMIAQIGTPGVVAGSGELYTRTVNDGINDDTELLYQTAGGKIIQLTRNFDPVASANGYTMLPGGLILQWGEISPTSLETVPISFNITFPSTVFNIQITAFRSTSSDNPSFFLISPTLTTGFSIKNNSGASFGYGWVAIGN